MTIDLTLAAALGALVLLAAIAVFLAVRLDAARKRDAEDAAELEEAEDALEAERAAHGETRERLQAREIDLREATVRAAAIPKLEEKVAALETRASAAERELEAARSQAAERDRAHKEKVETLVAFREDMEKQFKALSNEALTAQSERFTASSKERLETLLTPLREQIGKFETNFVADGQTRAEQSASLKTMVETLAKETGKTQETAENLARALKGSSQTQGAWGEMILQTILDNSGLREGEEYHTQQSHTLEDGGRLRPDVVVNLPGGRKLVIDSKVSLTAFNDCVNCDTDEARALHVKSHVASLRGHIKDLAGKDYSSLHGGVDFVFLFVPIEAALSLAVQTDPTITGHAVEKRVMIASPTTLMMALQTVEHLWRVERQNQNAYDIASRAGKIYDKFVGFVNDLEDVGSTIMKAHGKYEDAYNKLCDGRDNLVRQTEKLKQLGARTSKSLPDDMLELSERSAAPAVEEDEAGRPAQELN